MKKCELELVGVDAPSREIQITHKYTALGVRVTPLLKAKLICYNICVILLKK